MPLFEEFEGIEALILEACTVINLHASRRLFDIMRSFHTRMAIAKYVLESEALYVRQPQEDGTLMRERVDLGPLLESGLLTVMDVQSEEEARSVVNFAGLRFDDGEAVTAALALHRGAAIATDDRRTVRILREQFPQVPVLTTPALIRYWAERATISRTELRTVLLDIEVRGNFHPGTGDRNRDWWQSMTR